MNLFGVRLFREINGTIVSPVKRIPWDNGILKAFCVDNSVIPRPHSDAVPAEKCNCGFYANWTVSGMLECANRDEGGFALYSSLPFAVGLVEAYGKVVVHEYGFRAEYMRIMGFLPVTAMVEETKGMIPEKLFGFPIAVLRRRLALVDDKISAMLCAKYADVPCLEMDFANKLLKKSESQNR